MFQARIFMAIAAATALSASVSVAQNSLEKCKVVKAGSGLIKANKSDCGMASHARACQNKRQ